MCLDEHRSGRSNRSLDVWFAFNLRWAFTFLPFLSFLQPGPRDAPAPPGYLVSCRRPTLPLPQLRPRVITSFLGNGVLTGLLYNAKPQWDWNILPLFLSGAFISWAVLLSVPVSGFAPGQERGPGFREKIRCPGVSIGLSKNEAGVDHLLKLRANAELPPKRPINFN